MSGERETDVFGVEHLAGTPLLASDGTFDTAEECMCYTCDPSGGGCVPTDGVNGLHTEPTCNEACVYGYAVNAQGECSLSLDAPDVSLDQCKVENQANWTYGCFTKFANRYGTCVGVPDDGDNGPRDGEWIYTSITDCETQAGMLNCTESRPLADNGSACLFPEGCDPLPGTWQLWRVNTENKWDDTPNWAATIIPNAQITWNPPIFGVLDSMPYRTRTNEYPQMMTNGNNNEWSAIERLWYSSVERYDPEDVPSLSVGFRRLDWNTIEVVIVATSYTNSYNPSATEPTSPPPGGRGSGIAVFNAYAPANECFVLPSLDFHAEFASNAYLLNMRMSPMEDLPGYSARPCIQGEIDPVTGGCECNDIGHGESCEYTCIPGAGGVDTIFTGFDEFGYPICELVT